MEKLSVKGCLSFGWTSFKKRPWFLIGASAVLILVSIITNIPSKSLPPNDHITILGVIGMLISAGLAILISMGKTNFYLRAHDQLEKVELSTLWHPHPYWKFLGATVLVGIATIVGLILLIVPGIIIGIIFGFTLYIIIDTGKGPIQAMKESARITKGNRWKLFLLGLALLGINIVGFCLILIGMLVTLPISALAIVRAYRLLSASSAKSST